MNSKKKGEKEKQAPYARKKKIKNISKKGLTSVIESDILRT